MQTLWARVAQVRYTPKFTSCLSDTAALALGRRTTTAAFRYRLRSLDVFTVLYSSVLFTAAVADSTRKNAQRKELNDAVGIARADLKALEDQQQSRLDALSERTDKKNYRALQGIWASEDHHQRKTYFLSNNVDEMKRLAAQGHWTWDDIFEWEIRESQAREALGFKDWKGIHLNVLESLSISQIEDALLNDPLMIRIVRGPKGLGGPGDPERFPLSWKKVRTLEWSMVRLACTLLRYAHNPRRPIDDRSERPQKGASRLNKMMAWQGAESATEIYWQLTDKIKQASHRISQLRQTPQESGFDFEKFDTPRTPKYGCLYDHNKTTLLNSALADIFQAFQNGGENLASPIGKIGYQILTADTPPNIYTYTLLIRNFAALGHPHLVKIILISMKECNIRPDADFLATLIDFYSSVGDIKAFTALTAQMKGFCSGLALSNPNTNITPATLGKYRFMTGLKNNTENYANSNTDPRDDCFPKNASRKMIRIYEKADMSQEAYGALIRGALNLFGYKQAMVNYINMISEGFAPTVKLLLSILQFCCKKKDWKGGYLAWQKIQATPPGAGYSEYHSMLRHCQACRKKGMYRLLLKEGVQHDFFPSLVLCFPEEMESMDLDVLLKSAYEHATLRERLKSTNTITEPIEMLWKYLGAICYSIVVIARELRDIELLVGQAPFMGRALAAKMTFERDGIVSYAEALRTVADELEFKDTHRGKKGENELFSSSYTWGGNQVKVVYYFHEEDAPLPVASEKGGTNNGLSQRAKIPPYRLEQLKESGANLQPTARHFPIEQPEPHVLTPKSRLQAPLAYPSLCSEPWLVSDKVN